MELSARSYLSAGISLTALTAIAFTPLVLPRTHQALTIPQVSVTNVRLAASATDLETLGAVTTAVARLSGIPGRNLIGVVDGIVVLIDDVFTRLIEATDDQTLVASLTILKTLSSDAYKKLAENLRRINPVITATTAEVGALLTSALTGSLQNVLVAAAHVANDPLSPASYVGLVTAGVASSQLLAGNGLRALQSLGNGGFSIAGIAVDEVTFQFNNAVSGLSALATQLGGASDDAAVENVVGAVQALAVTPVRAVFNLGSGAASTVLATANAGFDLAVGGAADVVDPTGAAPQPATAPSTGGSNAIATAQTKTSTLGLEKLAARTGLVADEESTDSVGAQQDAADDGSGVDTQTPRRPRTHLSNPFRPNRPARNAFGSRFGAHVRSVVDGKRSADVDASPSGDSAPANAPDRRVRTDRPESPASD